MNPRHQRRRIADEFPKPAPTLETDLESAVLNIFPHSKRSEGRVDPERRGKRAISGIKSTDSIYGLMSKRHHLFCHLPKRVKRARIVPSRNQPNPSQSVQREVKLKPVNGVRTCAYDFEPLEHCSGVPHGWVPNRNTGDEGVEEQQDRNTHQLLLLLFLSPPF